MGYRTATHQGSCQICGSFQMLPGGVLAKHGYTTRWGFFSGTCYGSGWHPFETHTDRIEAAIASAEANAAQLEESAVRYLAATGLDNIWVRVYVPSQGRRQGHYAWQQHTLTEKVSEHEYGGIRPSRFFITTLNVRGQMAPEEVTRYGLETREQALAGIRGEYAKHLRQRAAELRTYVAWQRERIAHWTPKPLTPRKAA